MPPEHFLKVFFISPRQEMAQDFYCIKESKEEEEDDIVNDEEIKSAKQGRSFKL